MIAGIVTPEQEAVIHLRVRGREDREEEIEVIIDTGFNGFLTLPASLIARLGLASGPQVPTKLADGGHVQMQVYQATVVWDQEDRDVTVLEAGSSPLAGMALLAGYDIRIQVVDGGSVTIEALN